MTFSSLLFVRYRGIQKILVIHANSFLRLVSLVGLGERVRLLLSIIAFYFARNAPVLREPTRPLPVEVAGAQFQKRRRCHYLIIVKVFGIQLVDYVEHQGRSPFLGLLRRLLLFD
jgi:hypothetical protein